MAMKRVWRPRIRPIRIYSSSVVGNKNPYDVLGVRSTADTEEIKSAFYRLSKVHHPDIKNDDDGTFKEILRAYQVLSHPKTRSEYDREAGIRKVDDELKGKNAVPRYRSIRVDLSPERMAQAWERYKERWEREESHWKELQSRKIEFRKDLDELRSKMYTDMTDKEREALLENMRLLRKPESYEIFRQKSRERSNTKSNIIRCYRNRWNEIRETMNFDEIRRITDRCKSAYDRSEFLGVNYVDQEGRSRKYGVHSGVEMRFSKRYVVCIFGLAFVLFLVDTRFKNDVSETNRYLLSLKENNGRKKTEEEDL